MAFFKKSTDKKPKKEKAAGRRTFFDSRSFKSRAFRAGGYSVLAVVAVIAIAVAVNLLFDALPTQYTKLDTSPNQISALSEQSVQIVSGLKKQVTVYWLVQSGYEDAAVGQMLERYADLSDSLQVEKIDPVTSPNFASQYTQETLYQNSLIVVCGENSRYIGNTDIYVSSSAYNSETGSYDTTSSFDCENQLTRAIDYVTSDALPVMYRLTGHGESDLTSTVETLVSKDNISVKECDLLTQQGVPADCECLLLFSLQSDLSADEVQKIETYLSGGGNLLLLTDLLQSGETLPNLEALASAYGVTLQQGLVIEGDSNYYSYQRAYQLLPAIGSHTITDPLLQGGYYILMPIAQGLRISDSLPTGISVSSLLTTSDSAYAKLAGYASVSPYSKEDGDADGPFCLAAAITDTRSANESKIVWFTTSAFLDTSVDSAVSGANSDLFTNAVDWMCEKETSISIRAKDVTSPTLTLSAMQSGWLGLLFLAVVPGAVLCRGIVVFVRRRKR